MHINVSKVTVAIRDAWAIILKSLDGCRWPSIERGLSKLCKHEIISKSQQPFSHPHHVSFAKQTQSHPHSLTAEQRRWIRCDRGGLTGCMHWPSHHTLVWWMQNRWPSFTWWLSKLCNEITAAVWHFRHVSFENKIHRTLSVDGRATSTDPMWPRLYGWHWPSYHSLLACRLHAMALFWMKNKQTMQTRNNLRNYSGRPDSLIMFFAQVQSIAPYPFTVERRYRIQCQLGVKSRGHVQWIDFKSADNVSKHSETVEKWRNLESKHAAQKTMSWETKIRNGRKWREHEQRSEMELIQRACKSLSYSW